MTRTVRSRPSASPGAARVLGIAADVIVPVGNDFNDDLVDLGAPALRARFAPLFRCGACPSGSQAGAGGSRSGGGREERGVGRADPEGGGSQ